MLTLFLSSDRDPCFSSPCENNGNCSRLDNSNYTCVCSERFTGADCETGKVFVAWTNLFVGKSLKFISSTGMFHFICHQHFSMSLAVNELMV